MLIAIAVITATIENSIFGIIGIAFTGTKTTFTTSHLLGSFFISTMMPLFKARDYIALEMTNLSTITEDDSSTENTRTTSARELKIDYKSLEGVMAEPKLLEYFSIFVAKHFKVEMIYFLLQVRIFD